jgi:2-furoyl-CoA dehydrogenase large subunit
MMVEGTINIKASPEKVWEFLTSPDFVIECAPGVDSVEVIVPDKQFKAIAAIGFGAAKVVFEADVEWLEMSEPRFAKMKAHGKTPGSGVDVISEMHLTNRDQTTDLDWKADIVIVGKLASTAARLMSGVTRNLTGSFFKCVKGKIES